MSRKTARIFACVALVLAAAGCGGGGGDVNGGGGGGDVGPGKPCDKEGTRPGEGDVLLCSKDASGQLVWVEDGKLDMANAPVSETLSTKCEKDSDVKNYSSSIGDVSKFESITPLGAMVESHITPVDHVYVNYPAGEQPAGTYTVMSPAEGTVVSIEDFMKTNGYPYPDHRIVIQHSCNLYSVFIHVGELLGPLKGIVSGADWRGEVAVKAGEVIADDSPHPGYDFSTFDGAKTIKLANEASYGQAESWKKYTAAPFGYFPDDVRKQMEDKSLRTSAPFDGRIDWDVDGTAQGVWFVENTNGYRGLGDESATYDNHGDVVRGYWDTHLAIAPHNVDNDAFIYSVGDWEGCPCQFMSVGNVDPSTIKPGSDPVVIELVNFGYKGPDGGKIDAAHLVRGYTLVPGTEVKGLLVLQVNDNGTIRVEKIPGAKSKAEFQGFGQNATTYVR